MQGMRVRSLVWEVETDPPPPSQGKAVGDPRPVDINSKMRLAEQLRQEAGPRPGDLFLLPLSQETPL